ncbi:hypothetical protein AM587_10003843 [Phytophthora nicotianae]|nr:hypothetical protein AM587_10003843 [Phytophthora nicotianae]
MAKAAWLSDAERERIVQMRKGGVSVKDIAQQTERSANYIYRVLRKAKGAEPTKKKQKTMVSDVSTANARAALAVSQRNDTGEGRDQLLQDLTDPSSSLMCAVESMEVSAYEPIPLLRSERGSERQTQSQTRQDAVNSAVSFSAAANASSNVAKPHAEQNSEELWLLTDTTSTTGRPEGSSPTKTPSSDASSNKQLQLQPSNKRKPSAPQTSTQTSAASTSSLLVNLHLPRSRAETTNNSKASRGVDGLLQRVQDEIGRLEGLTQSDIYDAQLLQMLVKFHAETLLVQLQKTLSVGGSNKRARQDTAGQETSRLLRQKLAKEIALLNVQADRERLELEREQIRHKTTSMICRKTLLDANASPIDVDQLFPRQ